MKKIGTTFLCASVLSLPLTTFAIEPKALISAVLEHGQPYAEGQVTGSMAAMLAQQTHSQSVPFMRIERLSSNYPECNVVSSTTRVANIPSKQGNNEGELVMVSKLTFCPPGKLPAGVHANEVVSCSIGATDCDKFIK
jgi:hypothetical protein